MATVVIAVIVFGIVGLDVWFLIRNLVRHTGKLGCGGCSGCASGSAGGGCSECGGSCSQCSVNCGKKIE